MTGMRCKDELDPGSSPQVLGEENTEEQSSCGYNVRIIVVAGRGVGVGSPQGAIVSVSHP